jgi:hypothetical protein
MRLAEWFNPRTLHRWYVPPRPSWWIQPSGTPRPWGLDDYLLESPLGAHLIGGTVYLAIGYPLTGHIWAAWGVSVLGALLVQGSKCDALFPLNVYSWREVVWRLVCWMLPSAILIGVLR